MSLSRKPLTNCLLISLRERKVVTPRSVMACRKEVHAGLWYSAVSGLMTQAQRANGSLALLNSFGRGRRVGAYLGRGTGAQSCDG